MDKLSKERFFKAVDIGVEEKVIDKKRANRNVQEFLRAIYQIDGAITSKEAVRQINKMDKEDKRRLLDTYSPKTRKTILKGGR